MDKPVDESVRVSAIDRSAEQVAHRWLNRFARHLTENDPSAVRDVLTEDASWRDILAFTWHYRTLHNPSQIIDGLRAHLADVEPSNFDWVERMPPRHVKRVGRDVIETVFSFRTKVGRCQGTANLVIGTDGEVRAWTLMTALQSIHGHEYRVGQNRPRSKSRWADESIESADAGGPAVLIIGAGHGGLSVAARLKALGVRARIIEKDERVGDNWGKRYANLMLHNEIWANDLPYLEYPQTWPVYTSTDELARWFRAYAELLQLDVQTSSELEEAAYDEVSGTWRANVRRADGSLEEYRPRHIVMAVGLSGEPRTPNLPGLDRFRGEALHTSQYVEGSAYKGKKVTVIGASTSAHDVAQDLHFHGAEVTMVQRGPIWVISLDPSSRLTFALHGGSLSVEDADFVTHALPYPALIQAHRATARVMAENDAELLAKLEKAGMKLDIGSDGTGYGLKYVRKGGGYYIDVGCSELIADGKIALVHYEAIEGAAPDGLAMRDGSTREADAIVFAIGYHNPAAVVTRIFGEEVAAKVGTTWGLAEDPDAPDYGEMNNMWKRTGQRGLWVMAGGFIHSRFHSRYLANQILATELGMISATKPDRRN